MYIEKKISKGIMKWLSLELDIPLYTVIVIFHKENYSKIFKVA